MATHIDITTMKDIALHYGGKCLSGAYKDEHSLLEWMCEKGHRWESPYKVVNQGGWCMQCLKKQKDKQERLNELKQIAIEKGGKCLSEEYFNNSYKLEFECEKGHHFLGIPQNIKNGVWCQQCVKDEIYNNLVTKCQKLATGKGGNFLALKTVKGNVQVELKCAIGHQWKLFLQNLVKGNWCPYCRENEKNDSNTILPENEVSDIQSLQQSSPMQKLAVLYGGKCLSDEYIDEHSPLEWMCKKGHRWESPYKVVNQGGWCVECSKKIKTNEQYLQEMIDIATKAGGNCLSKKYINNNTKLEFTCSENHIWMARPDKIKNGRWCPKCARKSVADLKRDNIQTFYKIAEKHGGKCLSQDYVNSNSRIEMECDKGHRWNSQAYVIKAGSWCPKCSYVKIGDAQRDSIEKFKAIALVKGGKCLSDKYYNVKTKLDFECAKGHKWTTTGASINNGNWCHECAKKRVADFHRNTLEVYINAAKELGGKCLSAEYIDSKTKLQYQCAQGHTWYSVPTSILQGHWCGICGQKETANKQRDNIETYQKIAEDKGGKCLSAKYTNAHGKLEFQCKSGHNWSAKAYHVKQGGWCKICNAEERKKNVLKTV